jgi:hypothetical protein
MTGSSPADLAVAFRSFARRVREAAALADDDAAVAPLGAEVATRVGATATRLGLRPAPGTDWATVAAAVADHVAHVRASEWDEAGLAALRLESTRIAAVIRRIEALDAR